MHVRLDGEVGQYRQMGCLYALPTPETHTRYTMTESAHSNNGRDEKDVVYSS